MRGTDSVPTTVHSSNDQSALWESTPSDRPARPGAATSSSAPRRRSHRRVVIAACVLILAAAVVYSHFKSVTKTRDKSAVPAVTISTATAKSGDLGVYVNALGTVTPLNTVSLTARVAGQISKVEYTEGQLVHVGDPLVEIDPAPFQAAVTQAEGQLARDQASLELAKINLVRETDLLNKSVVSKQ